MTRMLPEMPLALLICKCDQILYKFLFETLLLMLFEVSLTTDKY